MLSKIQTCTFEKMKNILVLGKNGQLGRALQKIAPSRGWKFIDRNALDLAETSTIIGKLAREDFNVLINAAAYTAVDRAEDESELAFKINAEALAPIAESCRNKQALLIHPSTDYVFGTVDPIPIKEEHPTHPQGVYGSTKLQGEETIRSIHNAHFILRTAWLYGCEGHNFLNTMLDLGRKKKNLDVVIDQVGSPTFVDDLAQTIKDLIQLESKAQVGLFGTYHYSNEGVASWYDFAHAIFELTGSKVALNPVQSASFPTKAVRPRYSVLDKTKIKDTFGFEIPHWRDSLKRCLKNMNDLA